MSKEIIKTFYEKAFTVNTETTPDVALSTIVADDLISYGSVDSKGKNELIGMLGYFWKLIPDLKWEIQEILQDRNRFVVRSIGTGTPNGDFMGLPTNGTKSFKIMTIDIHQVEDNVIKNIYHVEDWATAIDQLS